MELEPLSPELVLVSAPDAAERARALLTPVQLWEPSIGATSEQATLGPLALIAAVH